ncbi:extracellular solute-binding protein [Candidatus Giovannonibacteria bacterium]|nr:extracellular solute-binding protein [Candidatus Giovannonibacteria bacterium]
MSKLQIILIGVSIFFTAIAVLIITGVLPGVLKERTAAANLTIWGFEKDGVFDEIFRGYTGDNRSIQIKYVPKNRETFENDFVNSLARLEAPDIVLFPSDFLQQQSDKLSVAPPILITEREIRQDFIEAGSFFLNDGNEVLGIPLYADALILYWNRDLFNKNFITLPPATWDDFAQDAAVLTEKDAEGNIKIAGAALGRAINIKQAPNILTALFLQAGEKIVDEKGQFILGNSLTTGNTLLQPAESSLRFFTEFSNRAKVTQSWSGALPEAKELFIAGNLAMYIGPISEYKEILAKNPHLNFAPTNLPQLKGATTPSTYGTVYALAVPKLSQNYQAAWNLIKYLTSQKISIEVAKAVESVSPRRDTLGYYNGDAVRSVFARAVLTLQLWRNPSPQNVDNIFRILIEDSALGRATLREILNNTTARLKELTKSR